MDAISLGLAIADAKNKIALQHTADVALFGAGGPPGPAGPPGPVASILRSGIFDKWTVKGPWDINALYSRHDVVTYQGSLYLAKYPNGNLFGDRNVGYDYDTVSEDWGTGYIADYGVVASWEPYQGRAAVNNRGDGCLKMTSQRSGSVKPDPVQSSSFVFGSLTDNTQYTFGCWMYHVIDPGQISGSIYTGSQYTQDPPITLSFSTWTKVSSTFTSNNTTHINGYLMIPSFVAIGAGNVVLVDDFFLYEGTVAAPIVGVPFNPAYWELIVGPIGPSVTITDNNNGTATFQ